MSRFPTRSALIPVVSSLLLLTPVMSFGQAAITGVVRDTSGGVLPGVTVEAASPVLIERVRSVISDDTGQYRIVDLRPGSYTLAFTLPGFSTVKREGIELTGTFVATVNADLRVGALEETITVSGETPVVDVQSARVQQTVSKDVIAAIPSSRSANGIQALIPGMNTATDSGGITSYGSGQGSAGAIHGGRPSDSRSHMDGLNTGYAGGNGTGGNLANVAGAQEVVISTSGGLGEADSMGVVMNIIPRDGGNTYSGTMFVSGATGALQGSNYTQELKDQGLKTPSEMLKIYDVNPMGGGRIIRDRLWFYLTYRDWGTDNTVPGMWVNRNAGNPNLWTTDFDRDRQAFVDLLNRNAIARITWQASARNKVNFHWSEQYNLSNHRGGGNPTQTIEATSEGWFAPSRMVFANWSSPITSAVLLEAGAAIYEGRHGSRPRSDGTFNPAMIRVQEQGGEIPGLSYRMPPNRQSNLIGTHEWKASIAYVTGAHNMKFGYQGGYNTPTNEFTYFGPVNAIRTNNGVPNRLTQTVAYPFHWAFPRNLAPANFYAQDQWTRGRLTLQGGVRWDNSMTSYPDQAIGGPGYELMPVEIRFPKGSTQEISWHDVTPRMGVAYDLFGNGKTALKFNLGKYMEANTLGDSFDMNLAPVVRVATSTTRSWTDVNQDFVPNCDLVNPGRNGECGAMDNQNFGKEVLSRTWDPNFVEGWGNRPYSWSMGVSVQQEIMPRVAVNVGYYRNAWFNGYVVDNRSTAHGDYTPFSINAPVDSRLPNGGGHVVSGLYDLVPTKVGQVDELAQHATNFADQTENWNGVDVNVTARFRNEVTVQGGTSTGRRVEDYCDVRASIPEIGTGPDGTPNMSLSFRPGGGNDQGIPASVTNPYCRVVQPFQTQIRGLVSYTVPRIDVQLSGTWSSIPGSSLAANFVANNAWIAGGPQPLGRPLSSGSNVTVNLIQPGTLYSPRKNNVDFRVAKVLRFGRTRSQLTLDVYNLTNTDVVTTFNQTFVPGGSWLTPTGIQPARYVKLGAQVDF